MVDNEYRRTSRTVNRPDKLARVPSLAALRARRSEKWTGWPSDVLPATVAEMDFELAPPVLEALRAAIDRSDLGYVPADVGRLARAFAGFACRRLAWTVDPEQVTVATDVMVAIVSLCHELARDSGVVAFAAPNYPPYFVELPRAGLTVRTVGLHDDGSLDTDSLAGVLAEGARVFVLGSPHNPLGRVVPRAELLAVAELCAEHDAWVIADEIHAPLVLPGSEHVAFLEVSDAAREYGIAVTSASKAFNLAALKCGLVVTASGRARDAVTAMPPQADHTGLLGVLAGEAAFTAGDPWLDAVLATLEDNRALLEARLAGLTGIRWTPPGASYLGWLDCRDAGLVPDPAAALLRDGRLAVNPGLDYGSPGHGFVRLNFGTSTELVGEMADRMDAALAAAASAHA